MKSHVSRHLRGFGDSVTGVLERRLLKGNREPRDFESGAHASFFRELQRWRHPECVGNWKNEYSKAVELFVGKTNSGAGLVVIYFQNHRCY